MVSLLFPHISTRNISDLRLLTCYLSVTIVVKAISCQHKRRAQRKLKTVDVGIILWEVIPGVSASLALLGICQWVRYCLQEISFTSTTI